MSGRPFHDKRLADDEGVRASAMVLVFLIDEVLIPAPVVMFGAPGDVAAGEGDADVFPYCVCSGEGVRCVIRL